MLPVSAADGPAGVQKKLPLKGVGGFGISPTEASQARLAAWTPEARGSPGFVGVWDLQALGKGDAPPPLSRRTFFRVRATSEKHTWFWGMVGRKVLGQGFNRECLAGVAQLLHSEARPRPLLQAHCHLKHCTDCRVADKPASVEGCRLLLN